MASESENIPESSDLEQAPTRRVELPVPPLTPGKLTFNRYELVRMIGQGGMGVVWAARDRRLELPVALKFLPEAVATDPEALRDLRREGRPWHHVWCAAVERGGRGPRIYRHD